MRALTISSLCLFFVVGIIGFTQVGCKGAEGPAGPPGSGFTGLEGFAPDIKCATCHSSEQDTTYYVKARGYQWSSSKHAVGGDLDRNGTTCAGCHTTEGFQQRWREGWATQVVNQIDNPSPPGCFACHSPHARNNFSTRDSNAVTITSFITGVSNAVFDYGDGNICVRCHQTRTSSPMTPQPDPTKTANTDTISITSSRWYPHYGVNGQMLMGTGGFQFSGYTYNGNSNHASNTIIKKEGCVKCHMAEPIGGGGGKVGGHTWWMDVTPEGGSTIYNLTGCRDAACHGTSFSSFDYVSQSSALTGDQGVHTYVERYLDTLNAMLQDTNVVKKWTVGTPKAWLTSSGTVNASSSSPLKISPASRAGALYNFYFLEHEGSHGIHNSKYAIELLQSSIAELRK